VNSGCLFLHPLAQQHTTTSTSSYYILLLVAYGPYYMIFWYRLVLLLYSVKVILTVSNNSIETNNYDMLAYKLILW
jgi:hypothetical protein